jgi:hypothetical protein
MRRNDGPINSNFLICFQYSVAGPLNSKRPADGLCIQIWFLKRLGLWPPETENVRVQMLYTGVLVL